MKNLKYILIVLTLFFGGTAFAQNNLEEISNSLKTGDIENIKSQLDEKVEVSIMENDSYTKTDAETMLNEFFLDKPNSDYIAIHKGSSDENSFYQIGELRTNTETYRTYFFTRKIDGDFLVQELRIERQ